MRTFKTIEDATPREAWTEDERPEQYFPVSEVAQLMRMTATVVRMCESSDVEIRMKGRALAPALEFKIKEWENS